MSPGASPAAPSSPRAGSASETRSRGSALYPRARAGSTCASGGVGTRSSWGPALGHDPNGYPGNTVCVLVVAFQIWTAVGE
jgi:hypothetical protein